MTRLRYLLILASLAVCSCSTIKEITYFQDALDGKEVAVGSPDKIRFKQDDKLVIVVKSRDPELTNLFNLPYVGQRLGSYSEYSQDYSQGICGYTINDDGCIDFPVLGKLHIEGMTRSEVESYIKSELITNNLVNDPIVTCEYMNLRISVMGEVTHPGRYPIDHDSYTIVDALSAAGDLAIYGTRRNVKVFRTENGIQKTYHINLNSAQSVASSPVYYLQQNDVIYVSPNKMRTRQSTVNGNNVRSTSFWISVASLAATLVTTFAVILK